MINSQSLVSKFKMPVKWASLLVPLALILAACQPAAVQSPTPAATSAPAATVAPTAASLPDTSGAEASLSVATDPTLGQILVDGNGMTLYIFTKDGPNQSNCTGSCTDAWPPLLTQGNPTLGPGVDASLIGTATLADGSKMVTYNKMPLYTWSGDTKAGDATGQGIKNVWFVVSPDGKPVGNEPAATIAPAATSAPAANAQEASLKVATDPTLGQILVDGNGMTLYVFTNDGPNQSNCTGSCADAWPPLLTQGNPTLGSGVDTSLVGTATLADGSKMVTYNKMPLYTFSKDQKPGDTTGQGVRGVWFVVSPDGKPVGNEPAVTTAPAVTNAPAASAQEASLNVAADSSLGQILVDGNGMTLYMFANDGPNQSNCTGSCADAWPPLLTQGNPTLGAGVDASLVGTATLADGSKMVTYNKMPLYTFSQDQKPGDTTGQGVRNVWFVVAPSGDAIGRSIYK